MKFMPKSPSAPMLKSEMFKFKYLKICTVNLSKILYVVLHGREVHMVNFSEFSNGEFFVYHITLMPFKYNPLPCLVSVLRAASPWTTSAMVIRSPGWGWIILLMIRLIAIARAESVGLAMFGVNPLHVEPYCFCMRHMASPRLALSTTYRKCK
jgi:hypothetical protein